MSLINRFKKELYLKILYIGPAKSGKSENLRQIYASMETKEPAGFLVHKSPDNTPEKQSLFFDFLPLSLGKIVDYDVRLHLFTIPGSGKYDAVTRLMLRGIDGVVCVLPSLPDRIEECNASLKYAEELLRSYGKSFGEVPVVFQYTFMDSTLALPIDTLRELYNPAGFPDFPAQAHKGKGVLETLRGMTHEALHQFKTDQAQVGDVATQEGVD